jgi:uncharacterized membrane protein
MMRRSQIARSLMLGVLVVAAQMAFSQTMYRVVPLPVVAKEPLAITSNGKLLVNGSNLNYYVCSKTHCRHLPLVRDDVYTHWVALNDQGMLTGDARRPTGGGQWAVRKDPLQGGGAHFLTPGIGVAIAADGAVIGRTLDYDAFLYTDHRITLTGLAGPFPEPTDINSNHVIVGRSRGADRRDHATMWIGGDPPMDLGMAPGHTGSWAMAINDAGIAVGYSYEPGVGWQPARFADGAVQVFLLPHSDDYGAARDINAAGTIVGSFTLHSEGRLVAGIVEGDRMVDLNTRLRPEDALRYNLWTADAINVAGEIAALHVDPQTNQPKAVRLEPIVEP